MQLGEEVVGQEGAPPPFLGSPVVVGRLDRPLLGAVAGGRSPAVSPRRGVRGGAPHLQWHLVHVLDSTVVERRSGVPGLASWKIFCELPLIWVSRAPGRSYYSLFES